MGLSLKQGNPVFLCARKSPLRSIVPIASLAGHSLRADSIQDRKILAQRESFFSLLGLVANRLNAESPMSLAQLRNNAPWILAIFIAFVFVQSLFFKFSNSFETRYIFGTIGQWMQDIAVLQYVASGFAAYGGYTIGTIELLASVLILLRPTQAIGALLAFCVIGGAIFFHLFTPLGISVVINEAGERDGGQLFAMAVLVCLSSLTILWMRRQDLLHRK